MATSGTLFFSAGQTERFTASWMAGLEIELFFIVVLGSHTPETGRFTGSCEVVTRRATAAMALFRSACGVFVFVT